ncbi:metalloreductase STEAP4-like [Homarus americanus]|uniref:metalloreductase STEAP4-like n=1 Tax=Homarus americanus TaxID=6706 RepID=UPI001C4956A7|nr:metalloreductase STEAP4-like [Homarus americanus]XP_042212283.1 metalloreductase STEAP4-like [Homarus americanus]XP_042212284.1 metalloreductase STEAP4-like [Homarus americanus]
MYNDSEKGVKRKYGSRFGQNESLNSKRESTLSLDDLSLGESEISLPSFSTNSTLPVHEADFNAHNLSAGFGVQPKSKEILGQNVTKGFPYDELKAEEEKERVIGVIGSGDYGRAIAGKIAQAGYTVLIGSRDPTNPQIQDLVRKKAGTRLVTQDEAARANTVVVAVGHDHYQRLPLSLLRHKVVIDVANSTSPQPLSLPSYAEKLQSLLPDAFVVKAFNVLSAYALENNVQQAAKQVPVASDWKDARGRVLEMVKHMGYCGVDLGPLREARYIEAIPLQLIPAWRTPLILVTALWLLHYLVLLFKFQVCGSVKEGESWRDSTLKHLALLNFNRTTAITALWTLTLCYLPGVGAAYLQLIWGTKYRRFPGWLDNWLKMRKQLGLLMLWLSVVHTCLGLAIWSGDYDALVWEPATVISVDVKVNSTSFVTREITIHNSKMSLQGELFLTMGTLSMCITCILGVSSLPSVSATLTWREFTFIQSKLGWVALLTATVHDGLIGWGFSHSDYTVCSLPSGAQYALHIPLLTILLKMPLLCPCVDNALQKIRRGHDRKPRPRPPSVLPSSTTTTHLDMTRRKRDHRAWQSQHVQVQPYVIQA